VTIERLFLFLISQTAAAEWWHTRFSTVTVLEVGQVVQMPRRHVS
jgi:hypothetical protein